MCIQTGCIACKGRCKACRSHAHPAIFRPDGETLPCAGAEQLVRTQVIDPRSLCVELASTRWVTSPPTEPVCRNRTLSLERELPWTSSAVRCLREGILYAHSVVIPSGAAHEEAVDVGTLEFESENRPTGSQIDRQTPRETLR